MTKGGKTMNRVKARELIEKTLKENGEIYYSNVEETGISQEMFLSICHDDLGLDELDTEWLEKANGENMIHKDCKNFLPEITGCKLHDDKYSRGQLSCFGCWEYTERFADSE